jgi:cyclopropane fatty-acyl-phospholipid synthase-like methyltransferase
MNNHNKLIANQYNVISKVFDSSRVRIWNNVKIFLLDNETHHNKNNTLLDCGCGNGKNMIYAQSLGYHSEGFDISKNLLDICKNKGLDVYYQDVLNMNAMNVNKKYNKIISIAVLHHLQTFDEQIIAIKNLYNCLDSHGKLLVSFWSKEKSIQDIEDINYKNGIAKTCVFKNIKSDSRDFVVGANYVDWKLDKENIIKRYYYIHDYNSIRKLAENINVKHTISWEQQNWFILFIKE